jgi:hypothetical protein
MQLHFHISRHIAHLGWGEEETKSMPHAPVQVMAKAHIASGKVC